MEAGKQLQKKAFQLVSVASAVLGFAFVYILSLVRH